MKKQIIITGLFILFVLGILLFSTYRTREIRKEVEKITPPLMEKEERLMKQPLPLIPSRPEDYGMLVIDESKPLRTQKEWDNLFSKKIEELKSDTTPQTWHKIQERIREDPQKTQEKLNQIDDNIKKCREILEKDPRNQEIKDKLERLMILKSIARKLPQNR